MLAPCSGGGGLSAPSLEQLPRAQAPAAWLSYATLQIEAAPTYSIKEEDLSAVAKLPFARVGQNSSHR